MFFLGVLCQQFANCTNKYFFLSLPVPEQHLAPPNALRVILVWPSTSLHPFFKKKKLFYGPNASNEGRKYCSEFFCTYLFIGRIKLNAEV